MQTTIGNTKLILICGDITEQETDAIVNAANPGLMGGGGVDGAIHEKGGPDILDECKIIRKRYPDGLPEGRAVITTGGRLKSKKVIHTVALSGMVELIQKGKNLLTHIKKVLRLPLKTGSKQYLFHQ